MRATIPTLANATVPTAVHWAGVSPAVPRQDMARIVTCGAHKVTSVLLRSSARVLPDCGSSGEYDSVGLDQPFVAYLSAPENSTDVTASSPTTQASWPG